MRASARLLLSPAALGVAMLATVSGRAEAPSDAPAPTRATPAQTVRGSGSCPDAAAVDDLLGTLLPSHPAAPPDGGIAVADLGPTFLVAVGSRAKTYADPSRDCRERARIAAAFIALELLPPEPALERAPRPAPPRSPARPTAAPPWIDADARGAAEVAPSVGLVAPGIAIGVSAGWKAFGARAQCGWISGASMGLSGGSVLLERVPCSLGPRVRVSPEGAPVEVDVEGGVALGALHATGRGFATTYVSDRIEVGGRLAADATLRLGAWAHGLAPVLGLEATFYPKVYDLEVGSPATVMAQTPYVWAGVTAGMCWSIE